MQQRERNEQIALVQWLRFQYPDIKLIVSANGGSRHTVEARNLKLTGVTAGVPDIFLPIARKDKHGLFIEMKAPGTNSSQKGRVSLLQQDWVDYLNAQGYHAVVAWGFEEAQEAVRQYLNEC